MQTSVIIGLLLIGAVWAVYLLPSLFGERSNSSMNSTEEFDRWTHLMADVQKRPSQGGRTTRSVIRSRRRRTLGVLGVMAITTLVLAVTQGSMAWLLINLFVDSLLVLYVVALAQMKARRQHRLKVTHVSERPTEWDEPQVKVIAN